MKLPLHLTPGDYSPETCQKRLDLHMDMQQLTGGKGFRQPPTKKDKPDRTRLRRLARLAGHG